MKTRRKLTDDLLHKLRGFVAVRCSCGRSEESVFAREGDYWTIMYQGEISERAAGARSEMDAIAGQISLAVGLGGRDRRMGCEAERARSTVTKRIKHSVYRIGS